jgi:hypothetical protein
MSSNKFSAIKVTTICLAILGGIISLVHGIFEILQGNVAPDGIRIEAIGLAQRFWEHGGEPALTIIPNFLITGILATAISILVIFWAIFFIDKKQGTIGLIILTILMLLFGGGFASPTFMILAIFASSRINKPLTFWEKYFPYKLRYFLSKFWIVGLLIFILYILFSIEAGIFGYPLTEIFDSDTALAFLRNVGIAITFVLGPIVIFLALISDTIKKK